MWVRGYSPEQEEGWGHRRGIYWDEGRKRTARTSIHPSRSGFGMKSAEDASFEFEGKDNEIRVDRSTNRNLNCYQSTKQRTEEGLFKCGDLVQE